MRRRTAEVHCFIVWSTARHALPRILDDACERFTLLDLVEVTWTPERFSQNLTRFYGDALPPGSDKEQHGGTDPFVVLVVLDARPRYGIRRLSRGRGWVNVGVIDARDRYRSWTGGGYRVHASESAAEAERDLVQLFGTSPTSYLDARHPASSPPRTHAADLVGTDGWSDIDELALQLRVTAGGRVVATSTSSVTVAVDDRWWAEHVAGGRGLDDGAIEIDVDGRPVRLELVDA